MIPYLARTAIFNDPSRAHKYQKNVHVHFEDPLIYMDLFHLIVKEVTPYDIDKIQRDVYSYFDANPFQTYGILIMTSGFLVSTSYYLFLLSLVQFSKSGIVKRFLPIMHYISKIPGEELSLLFLSSKQMIISCFAYMAFFYGFIYADGVAGTTWYHCNFYKMHFFEYQKYCNGFLLGIYVPDLLLLLRFSLRK